MASIAPAPTIVMADYRDRRDAGEIVALLDAYSRDPMGAGAPLDATVRAVLPERLSEVPGAFSLIARVGEDAVGLANCFTGFSTFAARPLVNIHDLAVLPGHRGQGVGRRLMDAIETEARRRGACKVTLEVLSGNATARTLYEACGFAGYALDPEAGTAQFWEKRLT